MAGEVLGIELRAGLVSVLDMDRAGRYALRTAARSV